MHSRGPPTFQNEKEILLVFVKCKFDNSSSILLSMILISTFSFCRVVSVFLSHKLFIVQLSLIINPDIIEQCRENEKSDLGDKIGVKFEIVLHKRLLCKEVKERKTIQQHRQTYLFHQISIVQNSNKLMAEVLPSTSEKKKPKIC